MSLFFGGSNAPNLMEWYLPTNVLLDALDLSFNQQNIFDWLNNFLINQLKMAAPVPDFSSTTGKKCDVLTNIAAKLVLYQRFHELVVTTYTSWQCSEVLDNHRLLLVILIQSV